MSRERIGWIGTGVMGASMCGHLLKAGYPVSVYNRTREKAAPLVDAGAAWCDSLAHIARYSDVIFTIVGYPKDVREVYLGRDGLLIHTAPGTLLIDMTTSAPSLAVEIAEAAAPKSIIALDAPVSGGDIGARNATLAIMVGGDPTGITRARPLFDILGSQIAHMGGPGAGQHTKMSNQTLIAGTMIGVVESLLYAQKAGLDLEQVIRVIGSGAAGSWSINNLGPRIVNGDFEPGFYIKHFIKDMGIVLSEADRMGISLPGLALVHQFYQAARAMGLEDKGTQALYTVLKAINHPRL